MKNKVEDHNDKLERGEGFRNSCDMQKQYIDHNQPVLAAK